MPFISIFHEPLRLMPPADGAADAMPPLRVY